MKEENIWYDLDNQANIYPAISDNKNTNVFRLSCTLKKAISPIVLQTALEKTIPLFPYYNATLRRGLFWYYLEPTTLEPTVTVESERPCKSIFNIQVKNLLYKVTYFDNRINMEVFHALADGGGAMKMFRTLIYNYIILMHKNDFGENLPVLDRGATPATQAEDSFKKYYTEGEKNSLFKKKAYTINGSTLPYNNVRIISAKMPSKQILALVKSKGVTLTAYVVALMICAIEDEMPRRYAEKEISISIPVDLRGMFPSQTFRNFFTVVDVRYNFSKNSSDFDSVLESVAAQLKEKVNPEYLAKTLNYNMSVQRNWLARAVPLFIKNRVMKIAYRANESTSTTVVSNVGLVKMPSELEDYIEDFHCLLNPTNVNPVKLTLMSFKNNMVLNFTSKIAETSIQKYFLRHLSARDIDITITTNWE